MKVALAHDFLTYLGGAERVLEVLAEIFPEAPIYTLLYDEREMGKMFPKERVHTSFLQNKSKFWHKHKQLLLTKFPLAVEQFDFSDYDLVISSSGAWMKGILTKPSTRHICYCHAPMRFAWDRQAEYLESKKLSSWKNFVALKLLNRVRLWDRVSADRPDLYLANSRAIQELLKKVYGVSAEVLYPPVRVERFKVSSQNQGYYLIVSRLSAYKNVELAVRAFAKLSQQKLLIIGTGEQEKYLRQIATSNVQLMGFKSDAELPAYFENCKALIFPGEDDFGITPVEAMACGKPVLAYARGGTLETVVPGKTGLFFTEKTEESLIEALQQMEKTNFTPETCRAQAEHFSKDSFKQGLLKFVKTP